MVKFIKNFNYGYLKNNNEIKLTLWIEIESIISASIPSLLSFSINYYLSSLARFGSFDTADLMVSKNLCFSKWSFTKVFTYSIWAPEIFWLFYNDAFIFKKFKYLKFNYI
jgi:hypothetical protein